MIPPTAVIVEDDPDIRRLLFYRFEKAGYLTWAFADGEAGGKAVSEIRPDIAVLDWMLPGRSGVDICRDVRRSHAHDDIGLIIVTARTAEDDRAEGLDAGADFYVSKPFKSVDLIGMADELAKPE